MRKQYKVEEVFPTIWLEKAICKQTMVHPLCWQKELLGSTLGLEGGAMYNLIMLEGSMGLTVSNNEKVIGLLRES